MTTCYEQRADRRRDPFHAASRYRSLSGTPTLQVSDSHNDDTFLFSERHLQCAWFDSRYRPANIRTANGETVIVESPGRWNPEPGPDFIGASVTVSPQQRRLSGDVEVHVRPSDWMRHNHTGDKRYSRVMLHVTYFDGMIPQKHLPAGAIQVSIMHGLHEDPSFSFEHIDLSSYPFQSLSSRPTPCASILATWSPADRLAVLESAGTERLRAKSARIRHSISRGDSSQTLYEEVLAALGFKHNSAACRLLAARLPLDQLRFLSGRSPLRAYALLLGVAGLIPATMAEPWDTDTRAFVRSLWDVWWKEQDQLALVTMPGSSWHLKGIRPHNHPARRLASAATLFTGNTPCLARPSPGQTGATWVDKITCMLSDATGVPYWTYRLAIGGKRQSAPVAVLGAERLASITTNVLVPFAAANGCNVEPLLATLPSEDDNVLVRQTASALFGRDFNWIRERSGLRQQGLLQIFHDFCIQDRSGCADCALAASLKNKTV